MTARPRDRVLMLLEATPTTPDTIDVWRVALALRWLEDGERVAREYMARCMCYPAHGVYNLLCPVHVPRRLELN